MQSFAKWYPSKDWHFMHWVGSGSSFRTGQRGPRMTSLFLIALFASVMDQFSFSYLISD